TVTSWIGIDSDLRGEQSLLENVDRRDAGLGVAKWYDQTDAGFANRRQTVRIDFVILHQRRHRKARADDIVSYFTTLNPLGDSADCSVGDAQVMARRPLELVAGVFEHCLHCRGGQ